MFYKKKNLHKKRKRQTLRFSAIIRNLKVENWFEPGD